MLRKDGIIAPDGHLDGYKYRPVTKVVEKEPWEVLAMPHRSPTSTAADWKHTAVNFELGEGIAYSTVSRPEANNALTEQVTNALHDATFELYRRRDIRLVVLRAKGKMFCAGGGSKSFTDSATLTGSSNRRTNICFMKFLYFFKFCLSL